MDSIFIYGLRLIPALNLFPVILAVADDDEY